jgi:predicted MFS family arabinose efflux permease
VIIDRRDAGVAAAGLCSFINLYVPQSILPTLADSFGVAPARTGLTITAPLLAVALVAPFVGTISDVLGRKRLIVAASFALVVPTLLVAGATSLQAMLLWRFIQGLLLPFIFAVSIGYIGDECPGAAGVRAAGTYSLGTIFGGFLGRFIAGVVSEWADWRTAFLVITALTVLGAAVVAIVLPRERNFHPLPASARTTFLAYATHLRNPRLLATCGIGFGMLFANVAVFTFVNFHLAAPPFALTPGELGMVFVVYLMGLITTPVSTRLVLRIGRLPTFAVAIALAIAGLLVTLVPTVAGVITGLVGVSGGLFVIQTLSLGYIAATVRHAVSTAVGLYVTIFYIGGALGGIAPAGVWQAHGWPGVVALLVALLLTILVLAAVAWRGHDRPTTTEPRGDTA